MSVDTYPIEERTCPYCGHEFDSATDGALGQKGRPEPGSLMICIECAGVFTPTDEGPLQKLDVETVEREMSPEDRQEFRRALAFVKQINEPLN